MTVAHSVREDEVLAVAAAMLRYGLPKTGASCVLLEVSQHDEGIWLVLVVPEAAGTDVCGDPGALMVVDSIADRWGSSGATGRPSTLWALLRMRLSAG